MKNNQKIYLKSRGLIILGFAAILLLIGLSIIFSARRGWSMMRGGRLAVQSEMPMRSAIVTLKDKDLTVEVAETDSDRYQGLSNRDSLCDNCGMLFNFPDSGRRSFVMRNMKFPLDIIFIENGVIKNIAAQLAPEGNEPKNIYESMEPVNQVLEVRGGYCETNDIKPGDKIWVK